MQKILRRLPFKSLILIAAGVVLYFLLGWYARFPLPFGLSLQLQYAVLGFFAVVYGPVVGALVGFLGEMALAVIGSGIWWSVVAAATFIGFATGFLVNGKYKRMGGFAGGAMGRYFVGTLLAHTIAWVVICSALDMMLYREALDNLLQRGLQATVSCAGCALVGGTLLLLLFSGIAPWQRPEPPRRPAPDGYDAGYPPPARRPDNLFGDGDYY